MKKILFFLVHLCLTSIAFAQNDYFSLESLDKIPGIPNQKILCMDTDSKGFIWLGTSEGIYRFDGNTASKYKYLPSTLSEVTVSTMLCTQIGRAHV